MNDLILINPPNHYHGCINPIGILNIQAICRKKGYKVEIVDLAKKQVENNIPYNEKLFEWLEGELKGLKAKCFGISIMNASMFWGKQIAKILKRYNLSNKILAGGPQITALKEKIFEECQEFEYLCVYEGEYTIPAFLEFLISNTALPKNILARDKKENFLYSTEMTCININDIPRIDYKDYLNLDVIDIEVGRGCPYHCYYCSANELVGTNIRYKSASKILNECQWVYNQMKYSKRKIVNFNHDNFLSNRKDFCKFVEAKKNEKYSFEYGCEGRIDAIDDEIIRMLYESKCKYLFIGIESGSEKIQKICRKSLNLSGIMDKVKKITDLDIKMEANFIIGFPEETIEDLKKTIIFATRLSLISKIMKVNYSIMSPEPCTDVKRNTNIEDYILLKECEQYHELVQCGIDVEKLNPLFYNNIYTIKNENYDILYFAKCAKNYFILLQNYFLLKYLLFEIKGYEIWEVFMCAGEDSSSDFYIESLMKKYGKNFTDIEREMVKFECDCNSLKKLAMYETEIVYEYPVKKIYYDFLKDKTTYNNWERMKKEVVRITIKNESEE